MTQNSLKKILSSLFFSILFVSPAVAGTDLANPSAGKVMPAAVFDENAKQRLLDAKNTPPPAQTAQNFTIIIDSSGNPGDPNFKPGWRIEKGLDSNGKELILLSTVVSGQVSASPAYGYYANGMVEYKSQTTWSQYVVDLRPGGWRQQVDAMLEVVENALNRTKNATEKSQLRALAERLKKDLKAHKHDVNPYEQQRGSGVFAGTIHVYESGFPGFNYKPRLVVTKDEPVDAIIFEDTTGGTTMHSYYLSFNAIVIQSQSQPGFILLYRETNPVEWRQALRKIMKGLNDMRRRVIYAEDAELILSYQRQIRDAIKAAKKAG